MNGRNDGWNPPSVKANSLRSPQRINSAAPPVRCTRSKSSASVSVNEKRANLARWSYSASSRRLAREECADCVNLRESELRGAVQRELKRLQLAKQRAAEDAELRAGLGTPFDLGQQADHLVALAPAGRTARPPEAARGTAARADRERAPGRACPACPNAASRKRVDVHGAVQRQETAQRRRASSRPSGEWAARIAPPGTRAACRGVRRPVSTTPHALMS